MEFAIMDMERISMSQLSPYCGILFDNTEFHITECTFRVRTIQIQNIICMICLVYHAKRFVIAEFHNSGAGSQGECTADRAQYIYTLYASSFDLCFEFSVDSALQKFKICNLLLL